MTPGQQASLEALAGRVLTTAEIALANNRADGALAVSLSVNRTVAGSVPIPLFAAWCATTGLMATLEDTSKNIASAGRGGALLILRTLSWSSGGFDLSSSTLGQNNKTMIAALVTAGIITAGQSAALTALAASPAPIDYNTISTVLGG